jgi:hypothetical protein
MVLSRIGFIARGMLRHFVPAMMISALRPRIALRHSGRARGRNQTKELSLPGLTGQSSNPCAIDVTVGRNRFIAPQSLRMAQCASLIAPYILCPIGVRWLLDRPVKPGDDSVWDEGSATAASPL